MTKCEKPKNPEIYLQNSSVEIFFNIYSQVKSIYTAMLTIVLYREIINTLNNSKKWLNKCNKHN